MKKGFMSIDGKFFTSEAKCKEHEATVGFVMYNSEGIVDDPNQAFGVRILSGTGYEKFCNLCNKCDSSSIGIEGVGDWIWDENRYRYIRLFYGSYKTIINMYNGHGFIEE